MSPGDGPMASWKPFGTEEYLTSNRGPNPGSILGRRGLKIEDTSI